MLVASAVHQTRLILGLLRLLSLELMCWIMSAMHEKKEAQAGRPRGTFSQTAFPRKERQGSDEEEIVEEFEESDFLLFSAEMAIFFINAARSEWVCNELVGSVVSEEAVQIVATENTMLAFSQLSELSLFMIFKAIIIPAYRTYSHTGPPLGRRWGSLLFHCYML